MNVEGFLFLPRMVTIIYLTIEERTKLVRDIQQLLDEN